jgi:5'-nucleotidase
LPYICTLNTIIVSVLEENKRPLILVSNDDGYYAKGLSKLIDIVKPYGDIVVVAPKSSESGMSHAISIKNPVRVEKIKEYDNVKIYACDGTPVDCVKIAISKILDRKPDFVVSGINHGSNSSISVIYSGTMGAAVEGCLNGIPSVGFSLLSHAKDADFTLAGMVAENIFNTILKKGLPEGTCLNVNVPVIMPDDFMGIKVCRQTKGVWKEEYDKRTDPHGGEYFWLTGSFKNHEIEATDTDEWALNNNFAAIVPVKVDLTSYKAMEEIKHWYHEVEV